MDPQRWKQIDELFDAALDVPADERGAFLDVRCGNDIELKREVLSLLAADSGTADFLETSALGVAARNLAEESPDTPDQSLIGRQIGKYEIESVLGSGGMGEVYLALDARLRRRVALKILPSEYTSSDERVKRFELEARAISALNHPNIVTIHDVGSVDGINFIATEFVEGRTIREIIADRSARLRDVLGIVIQACEALSAAHGRGIIHRDIKPENIIVRPDGYVKILDFGLAKLSDIDFHTMRDFSKTAKGVIIGTPAYMSPEQVADEKVDHRTDLWSLGVVIYEMLTGTNPFKRPNRQATFQAILSESPPLASTLNPEVPAELDQVLVKALEKDADLSYQTASDLRADLKRVKREIDSSPSWNSSAQGPAAAANSAAGRHWKIAVPAAVVALIAGFAGWRLLPARSPGIDWSGAKQIQVTQSPFAEGFPSFSPDGKSIVYSIDGDEGRDIFVQRIGGRNPVNLTPGTPEPDTQPAFSPDGSLIAFRSERNQPGIYLMEATGENVRRIAEIGYHPSWSPDGRKIAVSDKSVAMHGLHTVPNSSLYLIDVETGAISKLETGGDAVMPSWSPDGRRIAFWFVQKGEKPELATVPSSGGTPTVIRAPSSAEWNPVWSPDGSFLYFSSDRSGNMGIWRIRVDGDTGAALGEPEAVPTSSTYARHIAFSRDGKTIAWVRYESQSNIQAIGFDPTTLKADREPSWVTRGDHEMSSPDASPNGAEIAIRIPTNEQEDIGVVGRGGGVPRLLTNDAARDRSPRWSPDGKRVFFSSDRSGSYQIWSIGPDGSDPRQITRSTSEAATNPVPSSDGRRLAFTEILTDRSERSSVMDLTVPWNEQRPAPIVPPGGRGSAVARDWSDDGSKVLVLLFRAGEEGTRIAVYDVAGRTVRETGIAGGSPSWLSDGRRFVYVSANTIYVHDLATGRSTEVFKPFAYSIQQASVSPDDRTIYFRYLQIESDVWILDASGQH